MKVFLLLLIMINLFERKISILKKLKKTLQKCIHFIKTVYLCISTVEKDFESKTVHISCLF